MKQTKQKIVLSSIFLIALLTIFLLYYNRKPILKTTSNWLTAQTIPFNLLVNPQKVNKNIHPHGISLNDINEKQYQEELNEVNNLIHSFNQSQQQSSWLSSAQNKQLQRWIHQKSHRYIYSVTPLLIGQDKFGRYTILSANRYDDTHNIRSYRYQVYYQKHRVLKTHYLGSYSNNKPPKFIGFTHNLGTSGISKALNFLDQINMTLTNSGIINQSNATNQQYNQLGKNIGLTTKSGGALRQYAQNSNANQKNNAIIGYEISDVPRETIFFITQINKEKKYTYTLTYNRNKNHFTNFQRGKHSVSTTP